MSNELDHDLQRLIDAHPLLFRGKQPAVSSYVTPGWYALIDRLCTDIETELGPDACADVEVQQIKEKFGELRFYVAFKSAAESDGDDEAEATATQSDLHLDLQTGDGRRHHVVSRRASSPHAQRVRELIDMASAESVRTCEVCGARARLVSLRGYITALCTAHERQRQDEALAKAQAEIVEKGLRLQSALRDAPDTPRTFDIWRLDVNRGKKVVTLNVDEFEEQPIARFLAHTLPELTGLIVRAEPGCQAAIADGGPAAGAAPHPYAMRIKLGGREHPATLGLGPDGRWALRLGDPDADYLQRGLLAIEQLLRTLHEDHKIAGLVTGIDDKGRPRPNDGMLELYAWLGQGANVGDVERQVQDIAAKVGDQHEVSFVFMGNLSTRKRADAISFEPFFAWDGERNELIRRSWLPRGIGVR